MYIYIYIASVISREETKTLSKPHHHDMTNTMMMSELPGNLLEEILWLVPATSLKRLRSTCKRWNYLFYNKSFTRKHFDKATKQFLVLMLKESRVCSISFNLYGIPSVELTGELSLIDRGSSSLAQFEISQVSHCDGFSFDYTTERFGRLPLSCQFTLSNTASLSVVRNEKLLVLLQREIH